MELLPCPFCGSKAQHGRANWTYIVECTAVDCGAESGCGKTSEEAAAAWNRRAAPPALPLAPTPEMVRAAAVLISAADPEAVAAEIYRAMVRAHGGRP